MVSYIVYPLLYYVIYQCICGPTLRGGHTNFFLTYGGVANSYMYVAMADVVTIQLFLSHNNLCQLSI